VNGNTKSRLYFALQGMAVTPASSTLGEARPAAGDFGMLASVGTGANLSSTY
jgi:hypothetical protein